MDRIFWKKYFGSSIYWVVTTLSCISAFLKVGLAHLRQMNVIIALCQQGMLYNFRRFWLFWYYHALAHDNLWVGTGESGTTVTRVSTRRTNALIQALAEDYQFNGTDALTRDAITIFIKFS